jgi:hypothetical protein
MEAQKLTTVQDIVTLYSNPNFAEIYSTTNISNSDGIPVCKEIRSKAKTYEISLQDLLAAYELSVKSDNRNAQTNLCNTLTKTVTGEKLPENAKDFVTRFYTARRQSLEKEESEILTKATAQDQARADARAIAEKERGEKTITTVERAIEILADESLGFFSPKETASGTWEVTLSRNNEAVYYVAFDCLKQVKTQLSSKEDDGDTLTKEERSALAFAKQLIDEVNKTKKAKSATPAPQGKGQERK